MWIIRCDYLRKYDYAPTVSIADFYKQGEKKRRKFWLKLRGDFNELVKVLLLVFMTVFSLIHFYGITGIFSTGDSTRGFGYAAFMLVLTVWMIFSFFSRRRKERQ